MSRFNMKSRQAVRSWSAGVVSLWRRWWQWGVIAAIGVAAVGLGYVGLMRYFSAKGETRSFWDLCYFVLYLFVVESGEVSGPVPWQLAAARLLAPIVPAWTIIKALAVVFREQLQLIRLRFTADHVVICGLGRKGLSLAADFRREGDHVVLVEKDTENHAVAHCRQLGMTVLIGDARDKAVLRKARLDRARYLVAVCGEDGANLEIAMVAYQLVRETKPASGRALCCFVHIVDLRLCALFKHHRVFSAARIGFEVRPFSIYENSARSLLETHPLDRIRIAGSDPRQVHLVVVGFGQMWEGVFLQAAKIAHFANGRNLRITVVDKRADEKSDGLYGRYPQLAKVCEVEFLKADAEDPRIADQVREWARAEDKLMTVVICFDSDSRGLLCAFSLLSKLEQRDVPIFVRMADEVNVVLPEDEEERSGDWMSRIHPFGAVSLSCTRKALLTEDLDVIARATHQDFVERRRKEGRAETDPSMQPWERQHPDLRDSNRQQADHIPVKLRAIGCRSVSAEDAAPAITAFADEEVEVLARMEHARWNAERFLAGWTLGPRDPEKKVSPYLVDWRELPEEIKEYDRQPVRNVPYLLERVGKKICRDPGP